MHTNAWFWALLQLEIKPFSETPHNNKKGLNKILQIKSLFLQDTNSIYFLGLSDEFGPSNLELNIVPVSEQKQIVNDNAVQ